MRREGWRLGAWMVLLFSAALIMGGCVGGEPSGDDSSAPAGPSAPSHLTSEMGSIDLMWRDNSDDEVSFEVQRKLGDDGAWETIATLPANTTTYTDPINLRENVIVNYRVRAIDAKDRASRWSNISVLNSVLWSGMEEVVIDGGHAFTVVRNGLVIYDISALEWDPTKLGSLTPSLEGAGMSLAKGAGNYIFMADGEAGLKIIDVSDPTAPFVAATYSAAAPFVGKVRVAGNYAVLAIGNSEGVYTRLEVVNIQNPLSPVFVQSIDLGPALIKDLTTVWPFIYAAADQGLKIVEFTGPATLTLRGTYARPCLDAAVADQKAYLAVFDGNSAFFEIVNVAAPAAPALITKVSTLNYTSVDVFYAGGKAYLTSEWGNLAIWDVTDPAAPVELYWGTDFNYYAWYTDLVVIGNDLYISDNGLGLYRYDVTDPANLSLVSYSPNAGYMEQVLVQKRANGRDYAFVGSTQAGVHIVDVTDPAAVEYQGSYMFMQETQSFGVKGNYAYLTGCDYFANCGLFVVDAKDPKVPILSSLWATADIEPIKIMISGHLAYLIGGFSDTLEVVDIARPNNLSTYGTYNTILNSIEMAIDGDRGYVLGANGFEILDLSDPMPVQLGVFTKDVVTYTNTWGIAASGNYVYVSIDNQISGKTEMMVVDVTNPAAPVKVASVDGRGWSDSLTIEGNLLFIADWDAGITIVDITDPTNPAIIKYLDTPGVASWIYIHENVAYCADYYSLIIWNTLTNIE